MYYQPCQQPYFMEGMMPNWQFQGNQRPMQAPMQQPSMQQMPTTTMQSNAQAQVMGVTDQLPMEQSYIENILRLNRGKLATVYMSFEGERREFKGIVEAAGRDHIIISDPETGTRYLLLMVYLNYVTFDEEIEYRYPRGNMATYSPR